MALENQKLPPNTSAKDFIDHTAGRSALDENNRNFEMFDTLGVDPFDAPVPGESLTSDPDSPKPWERPPKFTNPDKAINEIFMMLTEDGAYEQVLEGMRNDIPLDILSQVILFKGFQEGYWSTDLMLLLVEPTIYILMWLADQAGIEATLDSDGDIWEEDDEDDKIREIAKEDIQKMNPNASDKVPPSLLAKMDEFQPQAGEI